MAVLDDIIVGVREDLQQRQRTVSLAQLEARLSSVPAPHDPRPAFRSRGISIIAEVKRASPSKGELAAITDPAALAEQYAAGGAAAISVLTEKRRFNGSLADLTAVRERVNVPILRKDFIVEEYQLVEARAYGADLALLIVAALDDARLKDLLDCALELGLTPLVETHTVAEVERAAAVGAEVIGVNNRDLKTLTVNIDNFAVLVDHLPKSAIAVAESGVKGPEEVRAMADAGADVVLIGEALVTGSAPADAVASMIAAGTR